MSSLSLKQTLDLFPGGLLITDTDSRVVYASAAFEARTGFAIPEIVGKKPGELWGGHMDKTFYKRLWHTISIEGKPFVGAVHNRKKNGQTAEEMLYITPLKDRIGKTCYYAAFKPEWATQEREASFASFFLKQAKRLSTEKTAFHFLLQMLKNSQQENSIESELAQLTVLENDLPAFVHEKLIMPTRSLFSRRFEDAPLIQAAQEHPEAFGRLYEKYQFTVRSYFLRRLGDISLAEDLSQEVFARAFRYLPSFRITNASYLTYLLHVAHSVLINYYRKQGSTPVLQNEEPERETREESGISENIETLLCSLSQRDREIMLLKYRDGFQVKEIAKQVGKTENAVKLILSRSRKKLKSALAEGK